jgi:hypothetical protein
LADILELDFPFTLQKQLTTSGIPWMMPAAMAEMIKKIMMSFARLLFMGKPL